MAKLKSEYGNWALIAGAAIGLGRAFCRELAKQGMNLFMIDNQKKELEIMSEKLRQEHKIETKILCVDLAKPNAVDEILEKTSDSEIRFMIYNAAFSRIKNFHDLSSDELDKFIAVNTGSQLKLVHAFSKRLIEQKQAGGILMMSSLAGLLGMQYIAPYAATKAFAWNLAEALNHELKPYQIDVMACIAGATATEAYLSTAPSYGWIKPQVMHPAKVAELALKYLGKKALFIPGYSNRINYFILTRLLPRKWASFFANKTMHKMYSHNLPD